MRSDQYHPPVLNAVATGAIRSLATLDDGAIGRNAVTQVLPVVRPHVRTTPVVRIDRTELGLAPGPLVLKLEQLQHSGSFKARGAFANLLLNDVPEAGVVAASGGNHGAAVAYAAAALGVPATVFVPDVSSPAKLARIESYGAQLVVGGASYDDARKAAAACRSVPARSTSPPSTRSRPSSVRGRSRSSSETKRPTSTPCSPLSAAAVCSLGSALATTVQLR